MSPKKHFKERIHNDNLHYSSKIARYNNYKIVKKYTESQSDHMKIKYAIIESVYEQTRGNMKSNVKLINFKRDVDIFKLKIEHMITVRQVQDNYFTDLIRKTLNNFTSRIHLINQMKCRDIILQDYKEILQLVSIMKNNYYCLSIK